MKKTALALILTIVLFSTAFISQTPTLASANPIQWWDLPPISYPSFYVLSPIKGESYDASKDIWLNFTVMKPSDWFTTPDCHIIDVAYCVDGNAIGHGKMGDNSDANQVVVEVNDPWDVIDVPSRFDFSFNLKGLGDGQHTLTFYVEGHYNGGLFGTTTDRARAFSVYTPTPTPTPTDALEAILQPATFPVTPVFVASAGIALAVTSLFVYFKKRQRNKNP